MIDASYFSKELTFYDIDVENYKDLFEFVTVQLSKNVTETFYESLLTREENYPTGLPTLPFGVAIPHGDPEHVLHEKMVLIKPKRPIRFREMGNEEQWVNTSFVVLMCLKKEGNQVQTLSKMMEMFTDKVFMNKLMNVKSKNELFELFIQRFID